MYPAAAVETPVYIYIPVYMTVLTAGFQSLVEPFAWCRTAGSEGDS
jgi:hypothetical protein